MSVILVTGGVGYIGSHTVLALLGGNFEVVIIDNLSNSSIKCLDKVKQLAGDNSSKITFYEVDLLDKEGVDSIFKKHNFAACIHFAGKKAVGESVSMPLMYYENNVAGTVYLLQTMHKYGVKNMVFSSSCTVYGEPTYVPLDEAHPLAAISPYGRTKLYIEEIMKDLASADDAWAVALLRYFNPVGAHASGEIGEDPKGIPNNLMPFVQQVAVGRREKLMVFGSDYNTRDGTCIRDYIHVCDLADAHVAALQKVLGAGKFGCKPINLGTGTGTTVLEMVAAFEKACGKKLPYELTDRRAGDTVAVWADTTYASKELGWTSKYTIEDACKDQWRWASGHPYGFEEPLST